MKAINRFNRDYKRDYRLFTSPFRVCPDFIIPGETKCGTTSFYSYLVEHPDIYAADVKEPNNFICHPLSRLYCKAHYPLWTTKFVRQKILSAHFITGEASAEYLSKKKLPCQIAKILPDIKIIVLMRNPVARAYSDYHMLRRSGIIGSDFREIVRESIDWLRNPHLKPLVEAAEEIEHSPLRYVTRGIYVRSLSNWFRCFPRENIHLVISEELFNEPKNTVNKALEFLGVSQIDIGGYKVKKKGSYQMDIDPKSVELLEEFYRPYNEQLYELIGKDLTW